MVGFFTVNVMVMTNLFLKLVSTEKDKHVGIDLSLSFNTVMSPTQEGCIHYIGISVSTRSK